MCASRCFVILRAPHAWTAREAPSSAAACSEGLASAPSSAPESAERRPQSASPVTEHISIRSYSTPCASLLAYTLSLQVCSSRKWTLTLTWPSAASSSRIVPCRRSGLFGIFLCCHWLCCQWLVLPCLAAFGLFGLQLRCHWPFALPPFPMSLEEVPGPRGGVPVSA